jgi:integrase/recombinase XerD
MKINRNGQAEALTKEMFQKVLNAIDNSTHRLIFALCWYTTERPGAILQLQVGDVYKDAAGRIPHEVIVIPAGSRKDKRTREVPCAIALRQELKAFHPPESGYLFPGRGDDHLTWSAYYKALQRTFERLGLRGYSTYSTRRGSLTTLARAGMSARKIQQLSGHATLSSLQRYLDVSEAEVQQMVSML